ncbi:MAG: hypothetical protein F4X65_09785 [Chloroflexi bacterium]|nr:hypothetical protein [Chloroflexota bacterium]
MDPDALESRIESLEWEVADLKNTVEAGGMGAVTEAQLEKAKSDLIWKFVMWNAAIVFGVFCIIGIVVAVLAYLNQQPPPAA